MPNDRPEEPEEAGAAAGRDAVQRVDAGSAHAEPSEDVELGVEPRLAAESEVSTRERVRQRAVAAREKGQAIVDDLERKRPENSWIETGFRLLIRDKSIAGGLLGGGLAYRFFFWTLALSVLASGGLGFIANWGGDVRGAVQDAGLSGAVGGDLAAAADESRAARLWLLIVGFVLVIWFSWGLLRALWLVHASAWRIHPPTLKRVPQGLAGIVVVPFLLVVVSGLAGWVRGRLGLLPGILAVLGVGLFIMVFWVFVQYKLPSRDVPWQAFIPGAALVALGYFGMQVFAAYFLADKLANASELYGVIGLASTLLVYLFLLGRIIVWAAELNAVAYEVREERAGRA